MLPVFAGLAIGWQWSGIRTLVATQIDPAAGTAVMAAAIALLAAGLGPWLPERLLLAALRAAEHWYHPQEDRKEAAAAGFQLLRALRDREPAVLWVALAVLASAAGSLSLLTLWLSGPFGHLYERLLERFLWTNLTLTLLEWSGAALLTGPAWAANSMVVAGVGAVIAGRRGHPRTGGSLIALLALGIGLAWTVDRQWLAAGLSGPQVYLLGVLPMFLLAGLAAWFSQQGAPEEAENSPEDPPEMTPQGEGVVWLSFVAWGIATALVIAAFRGVTGGLAGRATMLLLMGAGGLVGRAWPRRGVQHEDRCGIALWLAGIGSALVATMVSYGVGGPVWLQLILLAAPIGYAVAEAEAAWLARHGREAFAFGQLIHAILTGLVIGLLGAHVLLTPRIGAVGTMALGCLAFIALAGLLLIREREQTPHARDYRMMLATASMLAATLVLPGDVRRWRDIVAARPQERTAAGQANALDPSILRAIAESGGHSIALIGLDRPMLPPELGSWEVEVLPEPGQAARPMTSFRKLRLERRRYSLVYQRTPPLLDSSGSTAGWSLQWLRLLARHTAPGGLMILDVPLEGLTPAALGVIAATFERAAGPAKWHVAQAADGRPYLRLEAIRDNPRGQLASSVKSLVAGTDARVHSLACDRMTRALAAPGGDGPALLAWLQARAKAGPPSSGTAEPLPVLRN